MFASCLNKIADNQNQTTQDEVNVLKLNTTQGIDKIFLQQNRHISIGSIYETLAPIISKDTLQNIIDKPALILNHKLFNYKQIAAVQLFNSATYLDWNLLEAGWGKRVDDRTAFYHNILIDVPRTTSSFHFNDIQIASQTNSNSLLSVTGRPNQAKVSGLGSLWRLSTRNVARRIPPLWFVANFMYNRQNTPNLPGGMQCPIVNLSTYALALEGGVDVAPGFMTGATYNAVVAKQPILIDYTHIRFEAPRLGLNQLMYMAGCLNVNQLASYIFVDISNSVPVGQTTVDGPGVPTPVIPSTVNSVNFMRSIMCPEDFALALYFYPTSFPGALYASATGQANIYYDNWSVALPQYDFVDHLDSLESTAVKKHEPPLDSFAINGLTAFFRILHLLSIQISAYITGLPVPFNVTEDLVSTICPNNTLSDLHAAFSPFYQPTAATLETKTLVHVPWEYLTWFGGTMASLPLYRPPESSQDGKKLNTVYISAAQMRLHLPPLNTQNMFASTFLWTLNPNGFRYFKTDTNFITYYGDGSIPCGPSAISQVSKFAGYVAGYRPQDVFNIYELNIGDSTSGVNGNVLTSAERLNLPF